MSAVNIRKIEGNLKKLAAERQKIERDEKTKKKPTGKAKETIFVERDVSCLDQNNFIVGFIVKFFLLGRLQLSRRGVRSRRL